MTLVATGTLEMDDNIQYFCKIVYGKLLLQFGLLSADVENIEALDMDYYIKGLALYFFPVNSLSKQKRAMRNGTKKSVA